MTKIIAPPGAPQAQLHQVRWPYLLPASAAGYFQALYHTDNGLLKALHHVPAYLLEFSSNHWISPSPSASTQCSSLISHISKTELPEGCSQVSSTQPISQGHLCLLHLQVSASGAKNSSFQPLSKSASRAKSHRPSFGCHQRISTPELLRCAHLQSFQI